MSAAAEPLENNDRDKSWSEPEQPAPGYISLADAGYSHILAPFYTPTETPKPAETGSE